MNWYLQQLTGPGGLTNGPAGTGLLSAAVYSNQMQVCYRDAGGVIHDAWYDGGVGQWKHEQLTGSGGMTNGPAAAGDPQVVTYNNQMHVCYREQSP